jgi:hypothetical protein
MATFTVTGEELDKHRANIEKELVGEYGRGYHREIRFNVGHGMYHVYDHRELILSTTSAVDAAEAFNGIRPHG